jgi:hypothetical protein
VSGWEIARLVVEGGDGPLWLLEVFLREEHHLWVIRHCTEHNIVLHV